MHIVIGGFGRSGTTWLSDILSKCLGGLILFEPFHPCVYPDAQKITYAQDFVVDKLRDYLDHTLSLEPKNPWLLRNHLNTPLENHTDEFISYVWENSLVLGYKTIRANHSLSKLSEIYPNTKTILMIRHPLGVLSSINRRQRFWLEYGWENHQRLFLQKTLDQNVFGAPELSHLNSIWRHTKTKSEKIIFMWSVSFILSLQEVNKVKGCIATYEELYDDPYGQIQPILAYLGEESKHIHPSYFFTPSMTSLKTVHHLRKWHRQGFDHADTFWLKDLSEEESERLTSLCGEILSISKEARGLAKKKGYC